MRGFESHLSLFFKIKEVNLLNFNCFFKNKILKTHFSIKKKIKLKNLIFILRLQTITQLQQLVITKMLFFDKLAKCLKGPILKNIA